jgi:peroxiredoxin
MKTIFTNLFIFCAVTFPAISFAGNPEGYNIKITAKGIKEGTVCLLANYYGDKQYIKDSAKANANGEVIFKGTEKYAQGIYLFVPRNKRYFDFVMDEGQNFSLETDTLDYAKFMKVKGSDENKYFYDYQSFMSAEQKKIEPLKELYKKIKNNKDSAKLVQDKMSAVDSEVKNYKLDFIKNNPKTFVAKLFKAMEEPEIPEAPLLPNGKKDTTFAYRYYKSHYFDNIDFSDDRMLRTPLFNTRVAQFMDKMTAQTPDSINVSADYLIEKSRANKEVFKYMVWWITSTYESSKIMGFDAVFVHVVEKYYVTKQAYWVDSTQLYKISNRAHILKPLLLGKKAPEISMQDSTGKYVSLSNVKAKYTILVFWDHGCGHCKKEIPKLAELYKKIKSKGVEVYAVETEDKPEDWKKFIREYNLNWINVQEPDEYRRAVTKQIYDIYSTPVIYLLDENKTIKAKRIDSEQVGNFIELLEKEKNKK